MFKKLEVTPTLTFPKGGEVFTTIATSMGYLIRQDRDLYSAYLALCKDKGHDPKTHMQTFAEYCLEQSAYDTSKEGDTTYAAYTHEAGMFAARVNLIGLPKVKDSIIAAVPDDLKVRSHFSVMDGQLCGTVELVGNPDTVNANVRSVRDVLRLYGFGDIESMNLDLEDDNSEMGCITTLARRALPQ